MSDPSLRFQCLLGMQCSDFAMIAADQMDTMSIIIMKHDENKLHNLSNRHMMGIIGESGDTGQFTHFITKNMSLYKIRNGYQLSTHAVAHFVRNNIMEAYKSGTPAMLNALIGGYDAACGGQLYTLDFLGSSIRVPTAVHGFGGLICMSILDRYHKTNLTETEAYDLLKTCIHEIHQRLFVNLPNFQVKVVNKHGIKTLPAITTSTFVLEKI